jgi:hypothetical protein
MWEARCEPGRVEEAVAWALAVGASSGAAGAEVFRSEDRVVLLTRWVGPTSWVEPDPDPAVVTRCHAWPFEAVQAPG